MEIKIIDPSIDERWDEFVRNHPGGTIFHTTKWAGVLQKTYSYKPCFFAAEQDGKFRAGFPFFIIKNFFSGSRLVALPFTDDCPPLFICPEDLKGIIFTITKMIKEICVQNVEIRTGYFNLFNEFNLKPYFYYKKFYLDLKPGLNFLWKRFKQKSIRYPIKKAQNYGVEISHSRDKEDVLLFYKLNLLTRKKHGVFPQPYKFFLNIHQKLLSSDYGFMLIAYYRNRPIAASIFFTYNHIIHHKFNASDPNYLRYQPNHLILWTAIQWAVENGYKIMDLGRTAPDNIGLMAFKRHWGAKEFDLPYYYWPNIRGASSTKESNVKYRIASSIISRTPLPVLKFAGHFFYKYFG